MHFVFVRSPCSLEDWALNRVLCIGSISSDGIENNPQCHCIAAHHTVVSGMSIDGGCRPSRVYGSSLLLLWSVVVQFACEFSLLSIVVMAKCSLIFSLLRMSCCVKVSYSDFHFRIVQCRSAVILSVRLYNCVGILLIVISLNLNLVLKQTVMLTNISFPSVFHCHFSKPLSGVSSKPYDAFGITSNSYIWIRVSFLLYLDAA